MTSLKGHETLLTYYFWKIYQISIDCRIDQICIFYRTEVMITWTWVTFTKNVSSRDGICISGRWQAPAAVLPMAQRQLTEGPRTKGTATRGPEGPESGKNMRARGPEGPEDELSWVPVLGACQCYYMFFTIQPKIAIFMAQFKYLNDGQNASKF